MPPEENLLRETDPARRVWPPPGFRRILLCVFISICVFIPFLFFSRPVRVGDGSEYYAMAVGLSETHRPYLTQAGWAHYDELYRSNAIPGISGSAELRAFVPELIANGGQDFPHFWFYSLGAAFFAEIADYAGLNLSIHNAFLLWHCTLLALLLIIAARSFKWRGLFAVLLLTFFSPAFWYLDKVHTEFFTFTLTCAAVILFLRQKYLPAALLLALTATQNISFSVISLLVVGIALYEKRRAKWKITELLLLSATLLVNALHPGYYLLRYGALSPQFVSGGAQAAVNLLRFYVWFLDPDIGLLPNWWFGVIIFVAGLMITIREKWRLAGLRSWLLLTLVYLVVSLLAQSSTVNLNSGASPGPSRYTIWYLALFIPALLLLLRSVEKTRLGLLALTLVVMLAGYTSITTYKPSLVGVAHCQPSAASYWIQKDLPWLYNPPPEVFAERYGGKCEPVMGMKNTVVIAPDCHKFLLLNPRIDEALTITGASGCNLDFKRVSELLSVDTIEPDGKSKFAYRRLNRADATASNFTPKIGEVYSFSFASILTQAVGADYRSWGLFEDWGIWTVGESATLTLPCPGTGVNFSGFEIEVKPFVTDAHPEVSAAIEVDGQPVWSGSLESEQTIQFSVPSIACRQQDYLAMRITVDSPRSRADLGISGDKRKLGLGFINLRYLDQ